MAFVFLNRYLDLAEAMEDADAGPLENADFVDTDIPFDFHMPSRHYVPDNLRKQVSRNWACAKLCLLLLHMRFSHMCYQAHIVLFTCMQRFRIGSKLACTSGVRQQSVMLCSGTSVWYVLCAGLLLANRRMHGTSAVE